jgi:phage terminase large subunit-like protein
LPQADRRKKWASEALARSRFAGLRTPVITGKGRAAAVIAFIEGLKITSGMHAGRPFKLRPWQKAIIKAIYETSRRREVVRPIRQALITVPRKNGKTQLAAALALCHLAGPEARERGQILLAAADRNQAALIMREMIALIRANEELADRMIIRSHNKTLEDEVTGSVYQALLSDATKAHGLSPSFVICDELAQWKKRDLDEALLTGSGAHTEPLMAVISTMSPDPNHVMSELVRYGEQVRDGDIEDPTFLPVIYAAPKDADWTDEKVCRACNPALADFRSLDEMRISCEQAKRLPAREPAFRLLYLNQPIDSASRFLNRVDWEACRDDGHRALTGSRCYLGLDLSSQQTSRPWLPSSPTVEISGAGSGCRLTTWRKPRIAIVSLTGYGIVRDTSRRLPEGRSIRASWFTGWGRSHPTSRFSVARMIDITLRSFSA